MRHYDPYDFSDSDSDNDEEMQTEEDKRYDGGADMEIEKSDSGSASSSCGDGTCSPTLYTTNTPSSGSGTAFSRSSPIDERLRDDTSDDGMSSDGSLSTWTFRREYGRGLPTTSDVYRLPADEEERNRLRKQHHMLIDIMGAKYPPGMAEVLESQVYGEKRVLDLGCGNGEWIKDVARDFPLSECLAIDLVPIRDTRTLPPNVKSEVDDVNLGLQHCYGQFDVVHCRLISSGVKDYQLLIEHVSRILRPGGLMELAEFDFSIYDTKLSRIPVSIDDPIAPPYWPRWMAHLRHAVQGRGGDVLAAGYLWQWTTNHGAFDNIESRNVWIPTMPGNHSTYSEKTYAMLRENIASFLRSGKPLICRNGLSEKDFEFLQDHTLWDLHHSPETQYTRLQTVWALKRIDCPPDVDEASVPVQ